MAAFVAIWVTSYWVRNVPGAATVKNTTSTTRIASVHTLFAPRIRRASPGPGSPARTGEAVAVVVTVGGLLMRPLRCAPWPHEARRAESTDSLADARSCGLLGSGEGAGPRG